MKSSTGVLCISIMQLVVGLSLLGIYESYKVSYMNRYPEYKALDDTEEDDKTPKNSPVENYSLYSVRTPLDWLFYLSLFNNTFCLFFCLAGILNSLKEMVLGFFIFNAVQVVLAFHFFVDVWTDVRVRNWSGDDLSGHEKAATAFIFFSFILAFIAMIYAISALQEIKHKAREEYNRLSVISDNLQFEADNEKF